MKWALIYVLTGAITGLHNFYQLMWLIWGAPVNLLNCTALLGSTSLLLAGILRIFQLRKADIVGLAGSALAWVYYAPLLVLTAIAPYRFWSDLQFHFRFHDYVPVIGPVLGLPFLILCTVHSISVLRSSKSRPTVGASVE